MNSFSIPVSIRWSDLDPNFHLRHSVYYDFGATCRIAFFENRSIALELLQQFHIGPILFREEAIFRREVHMGETLSINLQITRLRRDASRFSFRHEIFKSDGKLSCTIHVDCAWIDTRLRKLTVPPPEIARMFEEGPWAGDFSWE